MAEAVDYTYFLKKIEEIERELKEIKLELQNPKKLIHFIPRVIEIRGGEFGGGYKLRKPLTLNVEREAGTWCVENRELEVYGCGPPTLNDALHDAEKVFEALIEEYVLEDEEILDESAKELRKALLQLVEV